MKTQIDIVTGFLGSGKTRFINRLIRTKAIDLSRTMILQCEFGQAEIESVEKVQTIQYEAASCPDSVLLLELIKEYTPIRLIIESNGMISTPVLTEILESKRLRKVCKIHRIFFTISCDSFLFQYRNYGVLLNEQISQCDVAVKMNSSGSNKEDLSSINAILSSVNPYLKIYDIHSEKAFYDMLGNDVLIDSQKKHSFSDTAAILFALLVLLYICFEILRMTFPYKIIIPQLQNLSTIFMSILFEAFPFILIGVFVSSVIHVLIPSQTLEKVFSKYTPLAFMAAIFVGVIFPVCDCATVPVASRLIKKGVPVPIAITFLLAAPIVNPIVVLSTLYAFPGYPSIAIYRMVTGLLIALLTGIAFLFMFPKNKAKVTSTVEISDCDCGMCMGAASNEHGSWGKIETVLKHAANEFFNVGIYLIIGAMISSAIQVYMPKNMMTSLGGNSVLSVLAMMFAAFIMSICSTSDAFIARTFANSIPISSVMGFMALGPMLDLKNLMLLIGNFKKSFVVKFVFTVLIISFVVLMTATKFLFGWWPR